MPDFRGKFAFFYVTEANFWFLFGLTYSQLQADKPQHAWSHYSLPVFWDLCWYHTANAQATHAQHMRIANASSLEQQWRDTCEAHATRIRGSLLIIEQTNSRATISRVAFGVKLSPWLWESDCYANNCCWGRTDLEITWTAAAHSDFMELLRWPLVPYK